MKMIQHTSNITISAYKRFSVHLYIQLFVGGFMSYHRVIGFRAIIDFQI
jgi:hypothetical protein